MKSTLWVLSLMVCLVIVINSEGKQFLFYGGVLGKHQHCEDINYTASNLYSLSNGIKLYAYIFYIYTKHFVDLFS